MAHDHATVAEEEYLQIMFWLEEAGLPITGANIARAMQLSPPTVHEMIGRLERDGYVSRDDDKSLGFTDDGREHAQAIVRRHRLIERFLTDVLGIPWDEVHEEAERLEHAMSPVLEERMLAAIGDATTCPHGHPIVEGAREQGVLLADVEPGAERARAALRERGRGAAALPQGGRAATRASTASSRARTTTRSCVVSDDGRHAVSRSVAETVSVRAEPAPRAAGRRCPRRWSSPATATAAERRVARSGVAADLAQAAVERLVLRADLKLAPAHVRLVLADRRGERREPALAPGCARSTGSSFRLPSIIRTGLIRHLLVVLSASAWPLAARQLAHRLVKISLAVSLLI